MKERQLFYKDNSTLHRLHQHRERNRILQNAQRVQNRMNNFEHRRQIVLSPERECTNSTKLTHIEPVKVINSTIPASLYSVAAVATAKNTMCNLSSSTSIKTPVTVKYQENKENVLAVAGVSNGETQTSTSRNDTGKLTHKELYLKRFLAWKNDKKMANAKKSVANNNLKCTAKNQDQIKSFAPTNHEFKAPIGLKCPLKKTTDICPRRSIYKFAPLPKKSKSNDKMSEAKVTKKPKTFKKSSSLNYKLNGVTKTIKKVDKKITNRYANLKDPKINLVVSPKILQRKQMKLMTKAKSITTGNDKSFKMQKNMKPQTVATKLSNFEYKSQIPRLVLSPKILERQQLTMETKEKSMNFGNNMKSFEVSKNSSRISTKQTEQTAQNFVEFMPLETANSTIKNFPAKAVTTSHGESITGIGAAKKAITLLDKLQIKPLNKIKTTKKLSTNLKVKKPVTSALKNVAKVAKKNGSQIMKENLQRNFVTDSRKIMLNKQKNQQMQQKQQQQQNKLASEEDDVQNVVNVKTPKITLTRKSLSKSLTKKSQKSLMAAQWKILTESKKIPLNQQQQQQQQQQKLASAKKVLTNKENSFKMNLNFLYYDETDTNSEEDDDQNDVNVKTPKITLTRKSLSKSSTKKSQKSLLAAQWKILTESKKTPLNQQQQQQQQQRRMSSAKKEFSFKKDLNFLRYANNEDEIYNDNDENDDDDSNNDDDAPIIIKIKRRSLTNNVTPTQTNEQNDFLTEFCNENAHNICKTPVKVASKLTSTLIANGCKSIMKTPGTNNSKKKNVVFNEKLHVRKFNFIHNNSSTENSVEEEEISMDLEGTENMVQGMSLHQISRNNGVYSLRNRNVVKATKN